MSHFDLPTQRPGQFPAQPPTLPTDLLHVANDLESLGIAVWHQGDGLIEDLLGRGQRATPPTRAFLCAADSAQLLQALPRLVVTAADERRLTLGTHAGPIDVIPLGRTPVEVVLRQFGLDALGFAWRPVTQEWCDPAASREGLAAGRLDLCSGPDSANAFEVAPRRYWIAARLLAENDLDPAPRLIEAARTALPICLRQIPEGASARREVQRILVGRAATKGLEFLHAVGLSEALFPGMNASGARIVGKLESEPTLRWAAWLAGASTQRAFRKMRMPMRTARGIERLLRHHPIDRMTQPAGEAGLRRILQRLSPDEIANLILWRRQELACSESDEETRSDCARIDAVEARLERLAAQQVAREHAKRLAIDGESVMRILDSGPGRRVGLALAHLAAFIKDEPAANELEKLEAELRNWAERQPD